MPALLPQDGHLFHPTVTDFSAYLITPRCALHDAIVRMDGNGGVALVADDAGRLLHLLTDVDIRRALLAGLNADATIQDILSHHVDALIKFHNMLQTSIQTFKNSWHNLFSQYSRLHLCQVVLL